ncbi:MAG: DUF1491 family protein [Rhodobacteraceae bacterium]|nr:DUF1491 family protein [Paracoccaceae bacterium]
MIRLATWVWVQAYVRRLEQQGIAAFVVAHGDDTAGSVMIKVNTLDGRACAYQRGFETPEGRRGWALLHGGAEAAVDAALARQRGFDPDLWVVEVEDRRGRHLLEAGGFDL